jgi:hypothetical protein
VVVHGATTYEQADTQEIVNSVLMPLTTGQSAVPGGPTLVLTAFQTFPHKCQTAGSTLTVGLGVVATVCLHPGCASGYQTVYVNMSVNVLCQTSPVRFVINDIAARPVRQSDIVHITSADVAGTFMAPVDLACSTPGCTVVRCQPDYDIVPLAACPGTLGMSREYTRAACGLRSLQLCTAAAFAPAQPHEAVGTPSGTVAGVYGAPRHAVCLPDGAVFFVDAVCGLTRMSVLVRSIYASVSNTTTFGTDFFFEECEDTACNDPDFDRGTACPSVATSVRHTCISDFPADVAHVYTTGMSGYSTSALSNDETGCLLPIAAACPVPFVPERASIRLDTIILASLAGASLLVAVVGLIVGRCTQSSKTRAGTVKSGNLQERIPAKRALPVPTARTKRNGEAAKTRNTPAKVQANAKPSPDFSKNMYLRQLRRIRQSDADV